MGFFDRKKHSPSPPRTKSKTKASRYPSPPPSRHRETPRVSDTHVSSTSSFHADRSRSLPSHSAGSLPSGSRHVQYQTQHGPIIINQYYYINSSESQPHSRSHSRSRSRSHSQSQSQSHSHNSLSSGGRDSDASLVHFSTNSSGRHTDDSSPRWHAYGTQLLDQGASLLYDHMYSKFDDVLTLIDRDKYGGSEHDPSTHRHLPHVSLAPLTTAYHTVISREKHGRRSRRDGAKNQASGGGTTSYITNSYFSKVDLYANSKLPLDLPSFRVTTSTYPLLQLAAQYSERVYDKPGGAEEHALVDADCKTGTKAMYIKSVPMDNMGTIVFAIRGTATFMDWAVNLKTAPTAPTGFLDDARNFCHAGFLDVAKNMVAPVASRLRQLLAEDPRRCAYSLLITGHSAGGAVASLLYMHMLATSRTTASELNVLAGRFKRIHCVTFGSPPVSLYPLQTPRRLDLRKSLFYAFVNEGDPVARADKAYVKNLLELYAAPAPTVESAHLHTSGVRSHSPERKSSTTGRFRSLRIPTRSEQPHANTPLKRSPSPSKPTWRVPPSTLSNAGQVVVLRSRDPYAEVHHTATIEDRLRDGVVAQVASDERLRGLIWGDPVCHVMRLYAARIEALVVDSGRWGY